MAKGNWVQTGLFTIGIAIVLSFFLNVGFSLVYDRPEYPIDVCSPRFDPGTGDVSKEFNQEECDIASQVYNDALQEYEFKRFVFSVVVGVILLAGGLALANVGFLSIGFMLAGVGQLIFGIGSYWDQLNEWARFVILGVALLILIFVGWRFSKK